MLLREELNEVNKQFFKEKKDKHDYLQLGFFNNNHLMFIGSNPGMPMTSKMQTMTKNVVSIDNYFEREAAYQIMIKESSMGKFLEELINDDWDHISFSNIVKIPTQHNLEPSKELVDEFLQHTKTQISLVRPTLVICMGKFAGKHFGLREYYEFKKVEDQFYMMIPHPAYINRFTEKAKIIQIDKIRDTTNDWLKTHAVVKVSDKRIFYRDVFFSRKFYTNKCKNDYYFMEHDTESQYKSFDGRNLKKIVRPMFTYFSEQNVSSAKTYEEHLRKRDIWYYNNVDNMQHSKMLRCMYFDIENNFSNDVVNTDKEVTSIAFYDTLRRQDYVCVLKKHSKQRIEMHDANVKIFEDETKLLDFFFNHIKKFDLLSGWFSNSFDLPYLLNRAVKIGLVLDEYFGRITIQDYFGQLKIFQDEYIFFDAANFYKKITYFNKPPSYSLNAVAKFLLNEGKTESATKVDWMWEHDINRLIKYNLRDVYLLRKIIEKANLINYPLMLQQICPQDFENAQWHSKTIENLLHHKYWKQQIYFPTKIKHDKVDFKGATVLDSVAGIHDNVAVYDFTGMYPNIYMTFNYSPDTLVGTKTDVEQHFDKHKKDLLVRYPELVHKFVGSQEQILKQWILVKTELEEYYFLPKDWKLGVMPELELQMLNLRYAFKQKRDGFEVDSPQYHIYNELQSISKEILNSIYGVVGYSRFILYTHIVPASVTATARDLTEFVARTATEDNLKPLYGDTDAVFISFKNSTNFLADAEKYKDKLNNKLKTFITKYTQNQHVIDTQTNSLEFEKAFSKLLLTDVKKRYFGFLLISKGKQTTSEILSITGFETRHNDTPNFFKKYLEKAYLHILKSPKQLQELLTNLKIDIKTTKLEDLIIRTRLAKNIENYETQPIHVRALKNSGTTIRRGELVNMVYVQGPKEVIHFDETNDNTFKIDYDKYIDKYFVSKIKLIDDRYGNIAEGQTLLGDFVA